MIDRFIFSATWTLGLVGGGLILAGLFGLVGAKVVAWGGRKARRGQ